MDADDYPVEEVLKAPRRLMVPLYQRKYQWDDKRLLPFWEDVELKATEVLEGRSKFDHYMGALILSPVDTGSKYGRTPRVQVVDGQQRLTTFMLFLAALRECARDHHLDDIVSVANSYLFNDPQSKDTEKLAKYKLSPTPEDRKIFHDILDEDWETLRLKYYSLFYGRKVPKNTSSRAFRAYWLFKQLIAEFIKNGPSEFALDEEVEGNILNPNTKLDEQQIDDESLEITRFEALLTAVLERLKLVVIVLDERDDAQVIFETLNSKGQPLLAMDLVRNNIFHRAEKEGVDVETLYENKWGALDSYWWRQPAPNARPKRPRLDHFLGHVLSAETGESISMRELYAEYRAFAVPRKGPRFANVEDELRKINQYVPIYETLESRSNSSENLAWVGRKLSTWQVTTVYPVVFQIAASQLEPYEKLEIYELLYSYVARRVICGLTTKNLNRTFQGLSYQFKGEVSIQKFKEYFSGKTGDSTKFPDNEELKRGFMDTNAYYGISPRPRLMDVLWELEKASRSSLAEKAKEMPSLSIEHVMPQSWTDEWQFPDKVDRTRSEETKEVHDRFMRINTFGNLTLISDALNSSAGNKSFGEKKAKFEQNTGLFLNKWFLEKSKWDEDDIIERGEHLADLATQIWKPL